METLGLSLTFPDSNTSVRFADAVRAQAFSSEDSRILLSEAKQNLDGETILLVLKCAGAAVSGLMALLKFAKTFLGEKEVPPTIVIAYKGRRVELHGDASNDDLKKLASVLAGE